MKNKKGLEFSFGWLFALVVGAAIIFLAIYAAVKFISSEQTVQETEAAKQLEAILTPIETGYEEGKAVSPIVFPAVTRVYNNCSTEGNFGEQSIRVSTLFGNKWQEQGLPIVSYNKYIFSPDIMQAKELYVLSKQFEMPFKVANILIIWSDNYCFIGMPAEIEEEITDLNLKNVNITTNPSDCSPQSKKVCSVDVYDLPGCNIIVNPDAKSVTKSGKVVYYEGSLIYGAIFSEPEVYECQVKRLMKRTSELALLYNAKSELIAAESEGCSSELQGDLEALAIQSASLTSTSELGAINFWAEDLGERQRQMTECKLWED